MYNKSKIIPIYIIDIDDTICKSNISNYSKAKPIFERINIINKLYDEGCKIIYWTSRGSKTGITKRKKEITRKQLKNWGCKYHKLKIGKPYYNFWIDDKAINANEFFK